MKQTDSPDLTADKAVLQKLLDSHDWFFRMSSSQDVFTRGKLEHERITALAKRIGPEGVAMIQRAKPNLTL